MGKQNIHTLSNKELDEAIENLSLLELKNIVKACVKEYHQVRYQLEKALLEEKS